MHLLPYYCVQLLVLLVCQLDLSCSVPIHEPYSIDVLIDPLRQGDVEELETRRIVPKSVLNVPQVNRCPPGQTQISNGGPCVKRVSSGIADADQKLIAELTKDFFNKRKPPRRHHRTTTPRTFTFHETVPTTTDPTTTMGNPPRDSVPAVTMMSSNPAAIAQHGEDQITTETTVLPLKEDVIQTTELPTEPSHILDETGERETSLAPTKEDDIHPSSETPYSFTDRGPNNDEELTATETPGISQTTVFQTADEADLLSFSEVPQEMTTTEFQLPSSHPSIPEDESMDGPRNVPNNSSQSGKGDIEESTSLPFILIVSEEGRNGAATATSATRVVFPTEEREEDDGEEKEIDVTTGNPSEKSERNNTSSSERTKEALGTTTADVLPWEKPVNPNTGKNGIRLVAHSEVIRGEGESQVVVDNASENQDIDGIKKDSPALAIGETVRFEGPAFPTGNTPPSLVSRDDFSPVEQQSTIFPTFTGVEEVVVEERGNDSEDENGRSTASVPGNDPEKFDEMSSTAIYFQPEEEDQGPLRIVPSLPYAPELVFDFIPSPSDIYKATMPPPAIIPTQTFFPEESESRTRSSTSSISNTFNLRQLPTHSNNHPRSSLISYDFSDGRQHSENFNPAYAFS